MCPGLGKALMSPHTLVPQAVPHKLSPSGGAGHDGISLAGSSQVLQWGLNISSWILFARIKIQWG